MLNRHRRDRRPRLTYIHQHFKRPDEPGGSRPYEFSQRLAAKGWNVTIICGGDSRMQYRLGDVTVLQLRSKYRNDMNFARRVTAFLRFAASSVGAAWQSRPDIIYASSTPLTVAIPALLAKLRHRVPLVFEVRDLWPEVPVEMGVLKNRSVIFAARLLERTTYQASASIIALSPSMREGVLQVAPARNVVVIPNTAQPDRFDIPSSEALATRIALGLRPSDFLVSFVGSLGRSYDSGWLLKLAYWTKDHNTGVTPLIIGEGAQLRELRGLAVDLGFDPLSTVPGPMSKDDAARIYAASDIVASCLVPEPSLLGNSLNKVFDAFAAGRPIIFNHAGWLSDLSVSTGAGWALSRDPKIAAQQLTRLLNHEELERAGQASKSLGRSMFNVDDAVEQLHILLGTELSHAPGSRNLAAEVVPFDLPRHRP